jgi:hypothetical protein
VSQQVVGQARVRCNHHLHGERTGVIGANMVQVWKARQSSHSVNAEGSSIHPLYPKQR